MDLSRLGWSLQLPDWFSAAQMDRGARSAEPLLVAAQQQGRGVGDGFEEEMALRSSLKEKAMASFSVHGTGNHGTAEEKQRGTENTEEP